MATEPRKRRPSPKARRARAARQQPVGINEEQLIHGHAFSRHLLADLVRAGFAVAERHVMAGDKSIEVVRVRITATGRGAIKR